MPALPVHAINSALSSYVSYESDLKSMLNLVMPRIYALGNWRDLVYDWTIETDNDYFALPEDAEALLGSMLENAPVSMRSRWHDYQINGYSNDGPAPIFGVIDDGFHAVKEDIDIETTTDSFALNLRPVTPDTALPSTGTVRVTGWRETTGDTERDSQTTEVFNLDGSSQMVSAYTNWHEITQVSFENVTTKVDVIAVEGSTDLATLARVRGDGVSRYRRYRFANPRNTTASIRLLLKRAWTPVLNDNDIVYLGNLNAIKHGLLGMIAEDNADVERANYHWGLCQILLENEKDTSRGAARPVVRIDPSGTGASIPNIL